MQDNPNTTLQTFNFEATEVRTLTVNDEPWFVAADVLSTLTLDRKALERLDGDEKGVSLIHTLGGEQELTIISESGLYSLILRSRKPEAKAFKRWVTHEVLPKIRQTGQYAVGQAEQIALSPAPSEHALLAKQWDAHARIAERLLKIEEDFDLPEPTQQHFTAIQDEMEATVFEKVAALQNTSPEKLLSQWRWRMIGMQSSHAWKHHFDKKGES